MKVNGKQVEFPCQKAWTATELKECITRQIGGSPISKLELISINAPAEVVSELFSLMAHDDFSPKGLANLESLVLEKFTCEGEFNNDSMKQFFGKLKNLKKLTVGSMFKLPKQMRSQIAEAVADLIKAQPTLSSLDFTRFSKDADGGADDG